jgi:dihydroflavonol-4-reductase
MKILIYDYAFPSIMSILVTGANGFIGSNLVKELVDREYFVKSLVRPNSNTRLLDKITSPHMKPVCASFADNNGQFNSRELDAAMENVDTVFHVGGAVKGTRDELLKTNVDGTINVYTAAREKGVKRFVYVSSLTACGGSKGEILTEDCKLDPVSYYGESKKLAEQYLQAESGIPTTIIRPSAVYGPGDKEILIAFKAVKNGVILKLGKGDQRLSFIHVDDLVNGMVQAAKSDVTIGQTYFISNEKTYSWDEFYGAIKSGLGKESVRSINIPEGVMYKVGHFLELGLGLFGERPMLSRQKVNEMRESWECTPEKAKRDFDYAQQISLEQGVKNTIDWYKENKLLK